jgi:hypothetical protein
VHCTAWLERHRYERIAGEPYYEEIAARAATFLHTALRLRPFTDYNASIGIGCIRAYMEAVGHAVRSAARRLGETRRRHPQRRGRADGDGPAAAHVDRVTPVSND